MASPVGALLDFMLDEVKAFMVIGSAAVRLWLQTQRRAWLLMGIGGLFVGSDGNHADHVHAAARVSRGHGRAADAAGDRARRAYCAASLSPIALVEALGKYVLHYPSWFLFVCASTGSTSSCMRISARTCSISGARA